MFTDKVYTGLDHAPAAFDLRGRILGPNGNNLDYIKSETGALVILKGGASPTEPLHVVLQHSRTDGVSAARSLTLNLIETVKNELAQWSAQTGQMVQTSAPLVQTGLPTATATAEAPETVNIAPANIAPANIGQAGGTPNAPVVAVRPQTVLQLMPQQQYILNQDGSQLIPLIQGGQMSGPGNFTQLTALPLGPGGIGSFPQTSVGATQFVDANLQPVSMAQFRLSSVPNSMQTFIQNGLALSQVSLANQDNTTVSYTSLLPVSSTGSSPPASSAPTPTTPQKQWISEKINDKTQETQVNLVAGDQVLTVPGSSQTMYIPYHQLQDLTSGQNGGTMQPHFVSIGGGNGMNAWSTATSLPLPQITQLQPGTALNPNLLHLNQKPASANTSVINLWSAPTGGSSLPTQLIPAPQIITPTGQVWSGQQMQISASQGTTLTPIPPHTPWVRAPASIAAALPQGAELIPLNPPTSTQTKSLSTQESRSQKRMSDGTPSNQIQLRPIAPAGSTSVQEKSSGSSHRWTNTSGRDNASSGNQMTSKGSTRNSSSNTANTQSSTGTMTISAKDRIASPARPTDKTAQLSQDASSKTSDPNKSHILPNSIQMYALSNNMSGMHSITPSQSSLAQPNGQLNQMYIVPSSQATLQNVGLPQSAMMGQTLQVSHGNMNMIHPNLALPHGVQYNTVPLVQLPQQMQYITPGLNLNNPGATQQLSLAMPGQQVLNPAMLSTLQSGNHQLTQLNSPTIQSLQTQMMQGSPNSNLQYSATPIQTIGQNPQQFISQNSQQQVIGNTSEAYIVPTSQYAGPGQIPQSNTIVMSSQNNMSQQYASVNQQSVNSSLNQAAVSGDSRTLVANSGQQTSYATSNNLSNSANLSQQTSFPSGIPQQYTMSTSLAQVVSQPVYPTSGSPNPNVISIPADNSAGQANNVFQTNQEGYPQSNTPTNANSSQTTPAAAYTGNQYAVPNGNRAWAGPRFGGVPPGNVAQYAVPPRNGQAPPTVAQNTNSNYWQYS